MRQTRASRLPVAARRAALLTLLTALAGVGAPPAVAQAPTPSPQPLPQWPDARIGVVTDPLSGADGGILAAMVRGARETASGIGAPPPAITVPRDASAIDDAIRTFVEEGRNVIIVGPQGAAQTLAAAWDASLSIRFIGVDQAVCLAPDGRPDDTGACEGDEAALVPNYLAISYREDQAGYLAGIVAASVSRAGRVAAIGAWPGCESCVRLMQGFELGARSVNPDIEVVSGFVADSEVEAALDDPDTGARMARAFIDVFEPDVILAAADRTGLGILEAACEAGISAIGSPVDQAQVDRDAADCTLTSAVTGIPSSILYSIVAIASNAPRAGNDTWDASRDGFGLAPFYELESLLPVGVTERIADALVDMGAGTIETCPADCGTLGG
jgi:basic membrane protein A